MTQHRRPLSAEDKAEKTRLIKREYTRKKRAKKQEEPTLQFIGPPNLVHLNSLAAPLLSPEEMEARKRTQKHLHQQPCRDRQKLLSPMYLLCTSCFNSWFTLHAGDFEYVLQLAPWETYSKKLGCIYKHGRHVLDETGRNGPKNLPKQEDYKVDNTGFRSLNQISSSTTSTSPSL